ncbi:hypothetical protein FKR81_00115 [Lentzea tibetensis]|uniref:Uncharacterized protein n=1 Tax=Lentzea tibetensis TaxID=2591470 RepID=A0A563F3T0_9PSEU|nr:hypothetical protein [Lentzea tibetensis]TWP54014.1 hypothetical protein FKR81_00115 [Lentzea tibetensis]
MPAATTTWVVVIAGALGAVGCGGDQAGPGAPSDPKETVSAFAQRLARQDTTGACELMTPEGQQAFARNTGTSSCASAANKIMTKSSVRREPDWKSDGSDLTVSGQTASYDGYCNRSPLHNIRLTLQEMNNGWLIIDYDDQIGYVCGG